jgi:hypothetical protein
MSERRHDYVPANATQFKEFMRNIIMYVEAHTGQNSVWANIPQERAAELREVYMQFDEAFDAAMETPTHANLIRRKEAQAQTTSVLRAFVNQFLRFPPITNADRAEMGIPNHDTIRTDHKVVTELVDFVLHVNAQREVSVDFWIKGHSNKAKPHGYDGAVLVWEVVDTASGNPAPENQDVLNNHMMASRTPFTLHFDETDRGKTVYVALRWQNERGITGAWSDIKDTVIP